PSEPCDPVIDCMTDVENCGEVGNDIRFLPQVDDVRCENGVPVIESCWDHWLDIDGDPLNGCEVPTDLDGDGHDAINFGGDDCNDNDGFVFLGAPEIQDLKDNNCNGEVDEGLTLESVTVSPTSASVGEVVTVTVTVSDWLPEDRFIPLTYPASLGGPTFVTILAGQDTASVDLFVVDGAG